MSQFMEITSVHERTVQSVAKGNVVEMRRRTRGKASRPNTTRAKTTHWSDEVHPLIAEYIRELDIHHSRIHVNGYDEVIISNH